MAQQGLHPSNPLQKQPTRSSSKNEWNTRFHLDPMPNYNVVSDKHAKQYVTTNSFQQRYKDISSASGVPETKYKNPLASSPGVKRRAVSASPQKSSKETKDIIASIANTPVPPLPKLPRENSAPSSDQMHRRIVEQGEMYVEEKKKNSKVWFNKLLTT